MTSWRTPRARIAKLLLVLAGGVGIAALSAYGAKPARQLARDAYYRYWLGTPLLREMPRTRIDCQSIATNRLMVVLIAGQSNAANFSNKRNVTSRPVFEFHDGSCYRAVDPLIGADGEGGSVWLAMADQLIARNYFSTVVLVPVAVGGTGIARWAPGGDLHSKLLQAVVDVHKSKMEFTHVIWHQGETDVALRTPMAEYSKHLLSIVDALRGHQVRAPIYVSLATYCKGPISDEVRSAQAAAKSASSNVLSGVDTDQYTAATYRYDDCHLSANGVQVIAGEWVRLLAPTSSAAQ